MPYLYAAFLDRGRDRRAGAAAARLRPPVRPARCRDLDDEYLFGRDLLVAPVTAAGVHGPAGLPPRRRLVRLAHRRACTAARGSSSPPTPMDRIPLYARAGAVVPMWPEAPASTDGHHPDEIELHLFVPRTDGSRTIACWPRTTASPGAARRRAPPHRDHRRPARVARSRLQGAADRRRLPGARARAVRPGAARRRRRRRCVVDGTAGRGRCRCGAVRQQRERVPGRAGRLTQGLRLRRVPGGRTVVPPADDTEVA